MRKKRAKPYWEMNTAELADATKQFDREFARDEFGPPPPEAAAQLRRAKRKRGRPRVGRGAKDVVVSLELGLLKRADAYAKRLGISRSQLVAEGLQSVIGRAKAG